MSAAVFAQTISLPWYQPVNARAYEPTNAGALSAEGQLILAARRRDPAAFEALVRRHQGPLYNFCLRMLGQADDAADVAQETFVQLYSHLDRLDEREPIAPWLFRVARNRCIDVIRRRRTVPLGWPCDSVLSNAIAQLPPAYAEVVALRYAGDRSFAEIAIILDCDEGAARVRFHRAKALLRRHLRAGSDGPDFPRPQSVGDLPHA